MLKVKRSLMERLAWALALAVSLTALQSRGEKLDHRQMHEAVRACAQANNIELSGGPPSEENRKVIDACLTAKGITPPKGPPPGGHHGHECGPPPEEGPNDSTANPSSREQ